MDDTTEKRTLLQGKMNKDVDERMLPEGQYLDATNLRTSRKSGEDMGVGKSVAGNKKLTSLAETSAFTNGRVIGRFADDTNGKIYYFITSDEKDFLVEFTSVGNELQILLASSRPDGVLNFDENHLITGVNKIFNGDKDKDLIAWTDDFNPPRIVNIERAKTYGIDNFIEDDISLIKKPPRHAPEAILKKTVTQENYLEDKFISFAYQFKYLDGEYSALSPFTNYAFSPERFDLDYHTMENNGMINAYNEVEVVFNTGSKRVTDVQLVFKESNSKSINIVESFSKEEEEWGNNEEQSFTFSNSKSHIPLPENELYRAFDNVPRLAKAQDVIGNRIFFGNYVEGYDLRDASGDDIKIDFDLELLSKDLSYTVLPSADVLAGNIHGTTTLITNFTGVDLVEGLRLSFDISMKAVGGVGSFLHTFSYTLLQDFDSCMDLGVDPDWIYFVEDIMTFVFEQEVNVVAPDDTISTTYMPLTTYPSDGNHIAIVAPTILFVVDETPLDPDDNPANTHIDYFGFDFSEVTEVSYRLIDSDTSLKTNRSYEVGVMYSDEYGRSSTVLTDPDNTIYIPQEHSLSQNKINVSVNHNPPVWADRYKFVVKQNKESYSTIYVNDFIEDTLFRWIKLEGANRDKIKEGDILIVKSDLQGAVRDVVKVRILEVATKQSDFITNNVDSQDLDLIEEAGLYLKIKPVGFDMDATNSRQAYYYGYNYSGAASGQGLIHLGYDSNQSAPTISLGGERNPLTDEYDDWAITEGVRIHMKFTLRERPSGGGGAVIDYDRKFTVQGNHDNFEDWWNAEVVDLGAYEDHFDYSFVYGSQGVNHRMLNIETVGEFSPSIEGSINIVFSKGDLIFETEPKENSTEIFYEIGQTFDIVGGVHIGNTQNQVIDGQPAICELDAFNCYVMGNGAESYQYKDASSSKFLSLDLRPSATSIEGYKEVRRFADVTYSEPYNENVNINGLNEFNLANANFKDDIDKKYGAIEKLYGRDTDLVVFQEDKIHKVLYGKDILHNADGSSNIVDVDKVLGHHIAFTGEYGISKNPESFSVHGNYVYFTDAKRGYVLRLGMDGITEISGYGMRTWFKDLFRDSINKKKCGAFDPYFDMYVLASESVSIDNEQPEEADNSLLINKTLTFDDSGEVKGWTSFHSFIPDMMVGMNNRFFSFKGGELYEHHVGLRNEYYGVYSPTEVSVVFNDNASEDRIRKTIILESNQAWDVELKTNYTESSITAEEFKKKESRYFAYIRRNEDDSDLTSTSVTGVGVIRGINGSTITFRNVDGAVNIGDILCKVVDGVKVIIGAITSKTSATLTINGVDLSGLVSNGEFCFSTKNSRIESSSIRGYYMKAVLSNDSQEHVELFAVNSKSVKSFV